MPSEKGFEFNNGERQELDKIKKKAEMGDITYDLDRWFGGTAHRNSPELLEIQRRGFVSEAIAWLKSATADGMKYGKASKEERLAKAREFAAKAETTIEELVEKHRISLLE